MTETTTEYLADEAKPKRNFWANRTVRISAITVGSAIVLAGTFGAGVAAGQAMSGSNSQLGGQFGPGGKNFPGTGAFPGNGNFPGGPNDPDHGAGTDRPDGNGSKWAPTGATSGTTTSTKS